MSPDHPSSRCDKVTNSQSRVSILRKYAKCFICLQSGHLSRNCTSNYSCRKCNKRHHISICSKNTYDEEHERKKDNTTHTNATHVYEQQTGVLLQTAQATVSGVDENKYVLTRVMLDSGSQRTYISDQLKNKLNLRPIRKEKIVLKTFGNTKSELKSLDVCQLKIKHRTGESHTFIEALCIPTICSAIKNQNTKFAKENYEHLIDIDLAESTLSVLIFASTYFRE